MFDFGDELVVGNYRIPWLIWIQLLVMFLLIILLYYFSLLALDLSDNNNNSSMPSSTPSAAALFVSKDSHLRNPTTTTTCLQHIKIGGSQSIKGDIAASTSKRIVRGEELIEREGSSISISENSFHLCHYIRLAREAFLKCFGLDSSPETSSTNRRTKKDS